mmetsp:Transcript_24485/g.40826  ORF Transcript_24485/g.40826 Transcript_24485/m.40826 type:complete len:217 (-) Transcript_24485:61-711(-)
MKKVTTGEDSGSLQTSQGTRPGAFDPNRKWTNGHKSFTSAESRALNELLNREQATRERFIAHKDVIKRPRNPLNGDPTPRDVRGEVVLNPNAYGKAVNSITLFNPNQPEVDVSKFARKEPMGKIGVADGKYDILGNTLAKGNPAEPEDLYFLAKKNQMKLVAKKLDQDAINASIVKDKLRRYELGMLREVEKLKQQLQEKEAAIDIFSATDTRSFM